MIAVISHLRAGFLCALLWCSVGATVGSCVASREGTQSAPCASPAFHQFDFWIGDWEVFDVGSPAKVAHARIDSILDGCVIREDYQGTDGHGGQSFTIYDTARNLWHQSWVTNRGGLLDIDGTFENGEMVLSGKDQQGAIVRGTWKPVNGEVREIAVKSTNAGKTWEPWFDIVFRRASETVNKTSATATDDEKDDKETVAALDTQYQEAVKHNDAATMGRILADDFILITSSGKTYNKAELLDEARSGRILYEHRGSAGTQAHLLGTRVGEHRDSGAPMTDPPITSRSHLSSSRLASLPIRSSCGSRVVPRQVSASSFGFRPLKSSGE